MTTFLRGARDTLPLLPGAAPFGMIYGVAARGAHIPAWLTQAMSVIVFAGSAQFAVVQLVAAGAPALVLALTGAILNLRHLLYSASLAPELRLARPRWKALLAYVLTDEMYGVVSARLRRGGLAGVRLRWYALGSGLTLWSAWQLSTLAGLLAGARIPSGWSLDFAATLTFIALVTPLLSDRPSLCAALVAALVAALALHAPLRLGLLAAILAGIAAGLLAERARAASSPRLFPSRKEGPPAKRRLGSDAPSPVGHDGAEPAPGRSGGTGGEVCPQPRRSNIWDS